MDVVLRTDTRDMHIAIQGGWDSEEVLSQPTVTI